MNKYLVIGIALLALAGVAFWTGLFDFGRDGEETGAPDSGEVETVSASGVVTGINTEEVAFDGPIRITIETEAGTATEIAVPSMGLPLCPAYQAGSIKDPYSIEVGATVEVRGASEEGAIVPCESEDHYLR